MFINPFSTCERAVRISRRSRECQCSVQFGYHVPSRYTHSQGVDQSYEQRILRGSSKTAGRKARAQSNLVISMQAVEVRNSTKQHMIK